MADVGAEDLDYHITFPSPIPRNYGQDDDEETPTVRPDSQEPVVILLGWVGCVDKHLAKYISIYERSCITIRYTAPTKDIFIKQSNQEKSATKLLELIIDLNLVENPIFFHVFSNGGGMIYSHMSALVHKEQWCSRIEIKGCIFDSAPSKRRLMTAIRAVNQLLPRSMAVIRYLAGFSVAVLLLLAHFMKSMKYILTCITFGKVNFGSTYDYFQNIREDPSKCPQLFLYSTTDDLVSYQEIENHMEYRRSLGIKVLCQRWEDSPHVQHFKVHRETYIRECQEFINMCLKD